MKMQVIIWGGGERGGVYFRRDKKYMLRKWICITLIILYFGFLLYFQYIRNSFCQFCGLMFPSKEKSVTEHLSLYFFTIELAETHGRSLRNDVDRSEKGAKGYHRHNSKLHQRQRKVCVMNHEYYKQTMQSVVIME